MDKEHLLGRLTEDVVKGNSEDARVAALEAVNSDIPAFEAIEQGLSRGMHIVSDKWDRKEYFLPELLLAADAMNAGLDVLKPHLEAEKARTRAKVVIGTVEGDVHDLGKSVLIAMFLAAGFEVHDLGVDVPAEKFVEKAVEINANIVASSAFMTTTMMNQSKIEQALKKAGVRKRLITMVGGAPTSQTYAESIGADGWAENALKSVEKARELLKKKEKDA